MILSPHLQVTIIIQARMGASRLPGKPLKEVLGKPLLFYLLERLKKCGKDIVVATTDQAQDAQISSYAQSLSVDVVCGSEEDVLLRYYLAAVKAKSDVIVRITADCPLMDPLLVNQLIEEFLLNYSSLDYLSNTLIRSYPRGLDIEIFSMQALERAMKEATAPEEREHVTLYLYRHPERFRLKNVLYSQDESRHRWTVDTKEDFELVKRIVEELYPKNPLFSFQDILQVMKEHPEWEEINRHIEQKEI